MVGLTSVSLNNMFIFLRVLGKHRVWNKRDLGSNSVLILFHPAFAAWGKLIKRSMKGEQYLSHSIVRLHEIGDTGRVYYQHASSATSYTWVNVTSCPLLLQLYGHKAVLEKAMWWCWLSGYTFVASYSFLTSKLDIYSTYYMVLYFKGSLKGICTVLIIVPGIC